MERQSIAYDNIRAGSHMDRKEPVVDFQSSQPFLGCQHGDNSWLVSKIWLHFIVSFIVFLFADWRGAFWMANPERLSRRPWRWWWMEDSGIKMSYVSFLWCASFVNKVESFIIPIIIIRQQRPSAACVISSWFSFHFLARLDPSRGCLPPLCLPYCFTDRGVIISNILVYR